MKIILFLFLLIILLNSLLISSENKTAPIYKFTERIIGKENAENFTFELTEDKQINDQFELFSQEGKIIIKGNSLTALTSGFNWYLKYYGNSHVSWNEKTIHFQGNISFPDKPVIKKSPFQYSYYLNYCTFNYSMAFWNWERWEREIDWMALNGINIALAMNGMEYIWKKTLERLDFTKEEIKDFIPGPAFNAWWLMGNLEGWGGPVSDEYIEEQVKLQKKIISRMKELGIQPILPGFYGMVPLAMKKKFPESDIRDQGLWAGGFRRPAFISPTDNKFYQIAEIYYDEIEKNYGKIDLFSGDPFHEGGSSDGIDLAEAGQTIIQEARNRFPHSIWVFQGWQDNPKKEILKNLKQEEVLILDLDCDNRPAWEKRHGWDGKNWLWNTIINFGGNTGLFGRMDVLANEPYRALSQYPENLKGIGALMEGIDNNYVMYELLFELKWNSEPVNLNQWLEDYSERRYGKKNLNVIKAWQILKNTVYNEKMYEIKSRQGTSESILCARPALDIQSVSTWGSSQLYYHAYELLPAWSLFAEEARAFTENPGFQYDFLDITRQVLSNYSQIIYKDMITAYHKKNIQAFSKASVQFIQIIKDMDNLLSSHESFMLGKWISDARNRGTNEKEKDLFELNARTQITLWSFQDSNLRDYAHKEWSGLLRDFYLPRWEMFINSIQKKMSGQDIDEPDYYAFESSWTKQTNSYPSKPAGNPIEKSLNIYKKYYQTMKNRYEINKQKE